MGTITALLSARSISASDIAESLAPKSTLSSAATFFPIKRRTPSPLPTAVYLTLILGLLVVGGKPAVKNHRCECRPCTGQQDTTSRFCLRLWLRSGTASHNRR